MAKDGKIIQRQHFCHYGDTICHPKSGCVTYKLHGTYTVDATIMPYFQTGLFSRFPTGNVNLAASKPWRFMPKYRDGDTLEIHYLSCLKFCFCLIIVSYIMVIL